MWEKSFYSVLISAWFINENTSVLGLLHCWFYLHKQMNWTRSKNMNENNKKWTMKIFTYISTTIRKEWNFHHFHYSRFSAFCSFEPIYHWNSFSRQEPSEKFAISRRMNLSLRLNLLHFFHCRICDPFSLSNSQKSLSLEIFLRSHCMHKAPSKFFPLNVLIAHLILSLEGEWKFFQILMEMRESSSLRES